MDINKPPYDKFIWNTDVAEEIRVFDGFIWYNTRCWPCRIDHVKYDYKIEWDKLFVKAFEADLVEFWKDYKETKPFYFLSRWKVIEQEVERYKKWFIKNSKRIHKELKEEHKDDPRFQKRYSKEEKKEDLEHADWRSRFYYKYLAEWHEFKYNWHSRYSNNAKKWILKKINEEDFDMMFYKTWIPRKDIKASMKEHPEDIERIRNKCPICGWEILSIYFVSPPETWEGLCWRAWPMLVCNHCRKWFNFFSEVMN